MIRIILLIMVICSAAKAETRSIDEVIDEAYIKRETNALQAKIHEGFNKFQRTDSSIHTTGTIKIIK